MKQRQHVLNDVSRFEAEQDAVMDAQFFMQDMIEESKLSRREIACLMGVSEARLSKMLRADANPTLRSVAALVHVLGGALCVSRRPIPPSRR